MAERIRAAGGHVRITSAAAAGTTVAFSVPLAPAGRRGVASDGLVAG